MTYVTLSTSRNGSQQFLKEHAYFSMSILKFMFCNVHIFWEGQTVVKSKGKISQNFVAFSEYMNFNSVYVDNNAPLKSTPTHCTENLAHICGM